MPNVCNELSSTSATYSTPYWCFKTLFIRCTGESSPGWRSIQQLVENDSLVNMPQRTSATCNATPCQPGYVWTIAMHVSVCLSVHTITLCMLTVAAHGAVCIVMRRLSFVVFFCLVCRFLLFFVYILCIIFFQNITIKAASIVEPLGFSGGLPITLIVLYIMQHYSGK